MESQVGGKRQASCAKALTSRNPGGIEGWLILLAFLVYAQKGSKNDAFSSSELRKPIKNAMFFEGSCRSTNIKNSPKAHAHGQNEAATHSCNRVDPEDCRRVPQNQHGVKQ